MSDLYSLLMEEDDANAEQKARAMAAALAGQQGVGTLWQMSGDKVLGGAGAQLAEDAARQRAGLGQAGEFRSGRKLRRAETATRLKSEAAEFEDANALASPVYHALARKFGVELQAGTTNRQAKEQLGLAERGYAADMRAREIEMNREAMSDRKVAEAEAKGEKELDKQIETLSKRMENTPGLVRDLKFLEGAAAQEDIPGVGTGVGLVPDVILGGEGIQTRQAVKGVLSTVLKEESGVAVSPKELDRKMDELGMGPNASEEQFRLGYARLKPRVAAILRGKEAGARPEAVAEARRRGLTTSADLEARPESSGMVRMLNKKGEPVDVPADKVAEAEARKWKRAP